MFSCFILGYDFTTALSAGVSPCRLFPYDTQVFPNLILNGGTCVPPFKIKLGNICVS